MDPSLIESKLNAVASDIRDLKKRPSGDGVSLFPLMVLTALCASGYFGHQYEKNGPFTVRQDAWEVTNRDAGLVTETILQQRSGETFITRETNLRRIWNLNAGTVTTVESREGFYYIMPHYAYEETTRPIADTDRAATARARALLDAPAP